MTLVKSHYLFGVGLVVLLMTLHGVVAQSSSRQSELGSWFGTCVFPQGGGNCDVTFSGGLLYGKPQSLELALQPFQELSPNVTSVVGLKDYYVQSGSVTIPSTSEHYRVDVMLYGLPSEVAGGRGTISTAVSTSRFNGYSATASVKLYQLKAVYGDELLVCITGTTCTGTELLTVNAGTYAIRLPTTLLGTFDVSGSTTTLSTDTHVFDNFNIDVPVASLAPKYLMVKEYRYNDGTTAGSGGGDTSEFRYWTASFPTDVGLTGPNSYSQTFGGVLLNNYTAIVTLNKVCQNCTFSLHSTTAGRLEVFYSHVVSENGTATTPPSTPPPPPRPTTAWWKSPIVYILVIVVVIVYFKKKSRRSSR